MTKLENEARNEIKAAKISKINSLSFSEYGLTELPEELMELTWLECLFINFNSLTDISILASLTNLKKLDLRGNNLKSTEILTNLPTLEYLGLDDNQVTDFTFVENIPTLQELYLSNNRIQKIPCMTNLQNLIRLELDQNCLEDVGCLKNLSSLKLLNIADNEINRIDGIETNLNLEYLNISNNKIKDIPKFLSDSLNKFLIGGNQIEDLSGISNNIKQGLSLYSTENNKNEQPFNNPLTIPPPEIVVKGSEWISRYFDELEEQGSDTLYEAKMLIIGEGGAGKTSLAKKIESPNCSLPSEDESTFGIDVIRVPIMKVKDGKVFYLNIWDFGGQEIYHSTHQFFLTSRSLYILIDDTRKDDKNVHDSLFSYWLQIVELLGGGSPLLIIQNEKSDRSKSIDLKSMQSSFDFIKECKPVNLLTNRGLNDVIEAIKYWCQQLPHIGETLPKQWIVIRRYLEDLSAKENHISILEYFKICSDFNIPEESRALTLSSYLHDLGVFIHYQEDRNLRNIIVLRNNWLTDAVYRILDDEEIKKSKGFFRDADLIRIWTDKDYKYHFPILLALMEKFELSYKLSISLAKDTWLAPQLLPATSPEYVWDTKNNIQIYYSYNFMPKGLLSRIIVRANRYITDTTLAWGNGVVLKRKEAHIQIREIYATRTITVDAVGDNSKEFITIIQEIIDNLNDTFQRIKVDKLIKCVCPKCADGDNPYFYKYQRLMKRLKAGKNTVECDNSYQDVRVDSLLDGVHSKFTRKDYVEMKMFISYAHKDEEYKDHLVTALNGLKITENITTWDDSEIQSGEEWDSTISSNMLESDIILLLVSADFIASRYIWEKELPIAMERDARGEAIVIPIFIRECDYTDLPFSKLQGLPQNAKPIASFQNKDDAYSEISKAIRKRLTSLKTI